MAEEKAKLKDEVVLRLYDKDGNLILCSKDLNKPESFTSRVIRKILEALT